MKIKQEDKIVENKTIEVLSEWDKSKPVEVCKTMFQVWYLLKNAAIVS